MDWVKTLKSEATKSPIVRTDEFTERLRLSPLSVTRSLARLESRGLVARVQKGLYVNRLASEFSPYDLVNLIRPCAYVSLESALHYWGISTQSPIAVTCVSSGKPRQIVVEDGFAIRFRTISEKLLWGYEEKRTHYGAFKLAEPEKALLDWVYLSLRDGVEPATDELSLDRLNRKKLASYANKFPSSVLRFLLPTLADVHVASD